MFKKEMYLDANAHLPISAKAIKAYIDFSNSKAGHGHPMSLSEPGRLAATAIEEARAKIAFLIGAKSANQIIFTSSSTQACEWAVQMFLEFNYKGHRDIENPVAIFPAEHPAIKDALEKLIDNFYNSPHSLIPINSDGVIQPFEKEAWNEFYSNKIICTHMQNEIGVIEPIHEIKEGNFFSKIVHDREKKYVLSDMSQSLGKVSLNVSDLNVDVAVFGAHKFKGPGGVGFIYLKDPSWWRPFGTGSRYFMDRTGSPDSAGIVASAMALEDALDTLTIRQQNMISFQKTLESGLKERGFEIVAEKANRSPNTTFVSIPGQAMIAIMKLGEKGIHVGLGSACGSMHSGPTPLIKVLGRPGTVHDYLRISQWGEYDQDDATYFLETLDNLKL